MRKQKDPVRIGRLSLKNPVIAASGTFGYGRELEGVVDLNRLGGIVTKTITLRPRKGNPMPRIYETASGMLNAIGMENEGLEDFIEEKIPYFADIDTALIASISGDTEAEFVEIAKELDKEGRVDAIELNISCPNIEKRRRRKPARLLVAQSPDATYEVVRRVRRVTAKTIITKLSPNVTDITEIARAACRGGTDAVSLVNTFTGMAIDVEKKRPVLGNITGGLSGPCIKPIALRMVWEVAGVIKRPVIGMGGIMTASDAMEFLIAGAKAVQVGTANFVDPHACERIIDGLKRLKEGRNG